MSHGSFPYPQSDNEDSDSGFPCQQSQTQKEISELKDVRFLLLLRVRAQAHGAGQVLKQTQIENGELRALLQKLKDENSNLKAATSKSRGPGRRGKGEDLSESDEVKALGKKWVLVVAPWAHPASFLKACPDVDPTSDDMFLTEEANQLRTTQELYDFIPTKFHQRLEHQPSFLTHVRTSFDLSLASLTFAISLRLELTTNGQSPSTVVDTLLLLS
jgi:hypothetical protein